MGKYEPPYTISNKMLELVSSISEKVGKISSHRELETRPHLRKNNRIRSIHSSLKIEANSLSLAEVRDVINGHLVLGDQKEIQEVKNAYAAYEKISEINPQSMSDLKKIHGIMTYRTVGESGVFRKGKEGVFSGDQCIFVAPPPNMVNELMKDLFSWVKNSEGTIHPLIVSAVFHYEFVFVHPFADGNGRIAKCHVNGNSDVFIEFMLSMIDQVLDEVIIQVNKTNESMSEYVKRMLEVMEYDVPYTANAIMEALHLKSKETFRKNYIKPAIELGLIKMTLPEKPNSKNQRYVKQ